MARGRPPKPVEKHVLDGTYRADRHGPLAGPAGATAPPPAKPADLAGEAAELWDHLSRLLAGVVCERDGTHLAELCRWWAELRRTQAGLATAEVGGVRYTALLAAAAKCSQQFDRLASRFGLTPADRARLKTEAAGPAKPKVAVRPPTKLDGEGPPTKRGAGARTQSPRRKKR